MVKRPKDLKRGELSSEEIRKVTPSEGFTLRTTGTGVGRPARDVFAVGFAPEEGRGSEVAISSSADPYEQMEEFNLSRRDILGAPGASMGQGGWLDPSSGQVVQDPSVLLPKTLEGLRAAMHLGSVGRQMAIGNLGPSAANPYIGDIDVPAHLRGEQFSTYGIVDTPSGDVMTVEARHPTTGAPMIRISPSRYELVDVEAKETSEAMGLPEEPGFVRGKKPLTAQEYIDLGNS